jgi:sialate O-acetylesterase
MTTLWQALIGHAALVAAASAASAQTGATLSLGPLFQDHAVLQRDRPLPIWGMSSAGERVTVVFGGHEATAQADAAGKWTAMLPPAAAGGPYDLEVRGSSGATRTIADLLIGDVFLCSGQSNMEMSVGQSRGGEFAAMRSASDRLRLISIAHLGKAEPASGLDASAAWQAADPKSVRPFSAACYFMGREVQATQNVPVGLIHASWGGTAIEPWLAPSGLPDGFSDALAQLRLYARDEDAANQAFGRTWETWWRQHGDGAPWTPEDAGPWAAVPALTNWKTWGVPETATLDGMVWFRRSVDLTAAQAAQPATLALGGIDEVDQTWVNGRIVRNTFGWGTRRTYRLPAGMLHAGTNALVLNVLSTYDAGGLLGPADAMSLTLADGTQIALGEGWRYRAVPRAVGRPPRAPWETHHGVTTLYNAMIAPLGPYRLRAVAWYQGESNTDTASEYGSHLRELMAGWRAQFGDPALPFLIVQLPNFGSVPTAPVESDWADLRDAQRRAVAADPHAGLVVTIDIGDAGDLHPGNKREVGRRLAHAARRVVYGEALPPSGPVVQSARREPDAVIVTFAGVTGTLVTYGADVAIGFELCGAAAGTCRYAAGRVDGNRVVLPVAVGSAPTRVRFCWGQSPLANLSDGSELPAGPFELAIDPQQSSGSPGR